MREKGKKHPKNEYVIFLWYVLVRYNCVPYTCGNPFNMESQYVAVFSRFSDIYTVNECEEFSFLIYVLLA